MFLNHPHKCFALSEMITPEECFASCLKLFEIILARMVVSDLKQTFTQFSQIKQKPISNVYLLKLRYKKSGEIWPFNKVYLFTTIINQGLFIADPSPSVNHSVNIRFV